MLSFSKWWWKKSSARAEAWRGVWGTGLLRGPSAPPPRRRKNGRLYNKLINKIEHFWARLIFVKSVTGGAALQGLVWVSEFWGDQQM